MTFNEIEVILPNGFHDAFLRRLNFDYVDRTAEMEIEVWVGDIVGSTYDESNAEDYLRREAYRRGELQFSNVLFFSSDVPNRSFLTGGTYEANGLGIDTGSGDFASFAQRANLDEALPEGAFLCTFVFTGDANTFLHIAAHNVEWRWLSEPRTIY